MDQELYALLKRMPKAELHVHIEGTLEPELLFELGRRNDVVLPYATVEALRAAYRFTSLQSFLDPYSAGAGVLQTAADFEAMAMAYFRRAHADGVVHAEVFFDPQTHTGRGIAMATVFDGLLAAGERAQAELGLSVGWILCALRHLSEEAAFTSLEAAMPWRGHLMGVGLDSGERGNPPAKFARWFAHAASLGLHRVAHAGEEGPAEYVRDALDLLKVERIDHGVRSIDDPALVERLVREQVPLTVCPLSNVRLCVYQTMQQHVLPELLARGACVTVNSDDPAYFGGYLLDNYVALFEAHPLLGEVEARQLAANSLGASFAIRHDKQKWLKQLELV